MENIIIRPAAVKDCTGIAKVHVKTWQCAYRGQLPQNYLDSLSIEKRQKGWEQIFSSPENKTKVYVATNNDTVIGFITVCPCRDADMDNKTGELGAIYVDTNVMGKGIGSQLMETGLSYLREQGFTKATLWVLTSNTKTRNWYESKGWMIEGETKSEPRQGFSLDEIRYVINLI